MSQAPDPGAGAAPARGRSEGSELETTLADCCTALRVGREAEAGLSLDALLALLEARLTERPERMTPALRDTLARAMDAQRRGDAIALADELEHVLAPLLLGRRSPP